MFAQPKEPTMMTSQMNAVMSAFAFAVLTMAAQRAQAQSAPTGVVQGKLAFSGESGAPAGSGAWYGVTVTPTDASGNVIGPNANYYLVDSTYEQYGGDPWMANHYAYCRNQLNTLATESSKKVVRLTFAANTMNANNWITAQTTPVPTTRIPGTLRSISATQQCVTFVSPSKGIAAPPSNEADAGHIGTIKSVVLDPNQTQITVTLTDGWVFFLDSAVDPTDPLACQLCLQHFIDCYVFLKALEGSSQQVQITYAYDGNSGAPSAGSPKWIHGQAIHDTVSGDYYSNCVGML
jgi:hypothetical protein